MNFFLYIPAHSSHPSGLIKSLVFGLLETYWRQNSFTQDYITMTELLFKRLLNRGYNASDISPIFNEAAFKINAKDCRSYTPSTTRSSKVSLSEKKIFFHYECHKRDVSRKNIRDAYDLTCNTPDEDGNSFHSHPTPHGEKFSITKLTVAYSRPKNLRDKLVPSTLFEIPTCNVQKTIDMLKLLNGQDA